MALCFLDTEFTDLLQPQLLSLGLVDASGAEHYAELDLQCTEGRRRDAACSEFVRHGGVLDQFGRFPAALGTPWEMGRRTGEWLLELAEQGQGSVEVCFDYAADWELLVAAVRDAGLWEQVQALVVPTDVDALTGSLFGELAAEECFVLLHQTRGLRRHHALADAHALRGAFMGARSATAGGAARAAACQLLESRARELQGRHFTEARFWTWLVTPAEAAHGRRPVELLDQPRGLEATLRLLVGQSRSAER